MWLTIYWYYHVAERGRNYYQRQALVLGSVKLEFHKELFKGCQCLHHGVWCDAGKDVWITLVMERDFPCQRTKLIDQRYTRYHNRKQSGGKGRYRGFRPWAIASLDEVKKPCSSIRLTWRWWQYQWSETKNLRNCNIVSQSEAQRIRWLRKSFR